MKLTIAMIDKIAREESSKVVVRDKAKLETKNNNLFMEAYNKVFGDIAVIMLGLPQWARWRVGESQAKIRVYNASSEWCENLRYIGYSTLPFVGEPSYADAALYNKVRKLERENHALTARRNELCHLLRDNLSVYKTVKALLTDFPDFKKYFPEENLTNPPALLAKQNIVKLLSGETIKSEEQK